MSKRLRGERIYLAVSVARFANEATKLAVMYPARNNHKGPLVSVNGAWPMDTLVKRIGEHADREDVTDIVVDASALGGAVADALRATGRTVTEVAGAPDRTYLLTFLAAFDDALAEQEP